MMSRRKSGGPGSERISFRSYYSASTAVGGEVRVIARGTERKISDRKGMATVVQRELAQYDSLLLSMSDDSTTECDFLPFAAAKGSSRTNLGTP